MERTFNLNSSYVVGCLYKQPNFKCDFKVSRTESFDSDLIIDRNGRRKTKIFGMKPLNDYSND